MLTGSALEHLHVSGFEDPSFDKTLFERLVLKESTKDMIKDLTEMYIRDNVPQTSVEENPYIKVTTVHKNPQPTQENKIWSPDFIQGKGDGLIILLHGKPGVGKTYTAGKERPIYNFHNSNSCCLKLTRNSWQNAFPNLQGVLYSP